MGYYTFKPKYLESMYKKSASTANLLSGIVGTIPAAIGLLLGGAYLTFLQPGPRQLTSFITIIEILGTMGYVSAFFLGCPPTPFAALPKDNANDINLGSQLMCNVNCSCSHKFQPICGPDNYTTYFSPCYAGCDPRSLASINGTNHFSGCDCIDDIGMSGMVNHTGITGMATEGFCDSHCGNNFEILIILMAIAGIVGRPAMAGNVIISFRIVDEEDKSLAMGVAGAFYSLFAFIPYPLVYGWVTNTACEVWESKCGKTGNCLVYDVDKFRYRLIGLTLGLYFVGSIFDIIVVFLSHRIKNLYNDDEDETDHHINKPSNDHKK
ncbi:unnamed protein product [Oppiella nova]|uniref:Kazal-like domain-containing protein n=1 Tax=Oppiella nova TaxID=334625 RepID=A0A7R9MED5_9ACAR|nr:unnamed protein product [Oppiella nova]CAG2175707.1 unnamed protein product [Oppiella nova]